MSADPLSYTTNGSRVDLGSLVSVSCVHNPTLSCVYEEVLLQD